MRINLDCPYSEKDQARMLGARWDAGRKTWYVENPSDLTPFMRWVKRSAVVEKHRDEKRPAKIFTTTGSNAPHVFESQPYPPWEDEPDLESIRILRSL